MPESNDDELKKLMVENLADTKILKEEIARIKSFMRWRIIISMIWIVLLLLPLLAGLFFIPDVLKGFATSAGMIQSLGL